MFVFGKRTVENRGFPVSTVHLLSMKMRHNQTRNQYVFSPVIKYAYMINDICNREMYTLQQVVKIIYVLSIIFHFKSYNHRIIKHDLSLLPEKRILKNTA